jgi:DhnA family fructose-bisphosphate aldolase class Ia
MTQLVDAGYRYGIPVLGVTAVGRELTRDARYLGLATRICAELGAQLVKTYYCAEGFEQVTAGCPVPIVMAGGRKLPERDALEMAYRAVQEGAAGVDMGRNIFQSDAPAAMIAAVVADCWTAFPAGVDMGRNIFQSQAPAAMIQAVANVVHEDARPDEAYELFRELSQEAAADDEVTDNVRALLDATGRVTSNGPWAEEERDD